MFFYILNVYFHYLCVAAVLCPFVNVLQSFLSFLLFHFLSLVACSVFCSCPALSDFAQTRLALGKGSPESALSTPGSLHHEYIMIPHFHSVATTALSQPVADEGGVNTAHF